MDRTPRIEELGEAAFVVRDLPRPAYALANDLNAAPPAGLVEAVASYETLGLYVEPESFDVDACLKWITRSTPVDVQDRLIEIPCRYDGPDMGEVSERTGLSPDEIAHLHAGREYRCYAIGFCPGFPYLGFVDDALVLPRKETPLERVPPGSVAIAGRQTGIYPLARPGGWWLIGTTQIQIVDLARGWFLLQAGDRVRFVPL